MAFDYSQDGAALGDSIKDLVSPIDALGIDPDEARGNQSATLAKVAGAPAAEVDPNLNAGDPRVGSGSTTGTGRYSQNGNELPAGMHTRSNPTDVPDAVMAGAQQTPQAQQTPSSSATNAAAASVSPSGGVAATGQPTQPSWADFARRGMTSLGTNMDNATTAAQKAATAPDLATINQPLQNRYHALSQPLNPNAKEYKVGIGGKILRGLEGAGEGILKHGVVGGVVGAIDPRTSAGDGNGYHDPNQAYYQDTANRAAQATTVQNDMTRNAKAYEDATARGKEVSAAFTAAGGMGDKLATSATSQQNADTAAQKEQDDSPTGKAEFLKQSMMTRMTQGSKLGLTGTALARFVQGSAPEQFAPNAELIVNQQAREAFRRETGHYPQTLAEEAQVREATSSRAGGGEGGGKTTLTPSQWQTLLNKRDDEYKDAEGRIAKRRADPSQDQAAVDADEAATKRDLQDRWDNRLAQADPEGKYAQRTQPAPTQAPAAQTQPSAAQYGRPGVPAAKPNGEVRMYRGQTYRQNAKGKWVRQ